MLLGKQVDADYDYDGAAVEQEELAPRVQLGLLKYKQARSHHAHQNDGLVDRHHVQVVIVLHREVQEEHLRTCAYDTTCAHKQREKYVIAALIAL